MKKDKGGLTKVEIRSVLISLNLSAFVVALFDETDSLKNHGFYNCCSPAYTIINATKKEQDAFFIERYVPLFETIYDFSQVLAYDNLLKGFVRYSPEKLDALKSNEVLTWDGTFLHQILAWYEDDKSDQEILRICGLLGLKYGQKILESIYR